MNVGGCRRIPAEERRSNTALSMWRVMYSVAAALNSFNWGLYFTFTRYYLGVVLGGGIYVVIVVTGLEWGFTLFALLSSRLVGCLGGRRTVLVGVVGVLPFIAALKVWEPYTLAVILSFSSLAWALSWPPILSAVFNSGVSPGKAYGYFTIGSGLGYSIGSSVMGILYSSGGSENVFITIAITYLTTYLIFFTLYPASIGDLSSTSVGSTYLRPIRNTITVMVAIALIVFTRETLYSTAPQKISLELRELTQTNPSIAEHTLFGVVFGGLTAILSIPTRVIAGKVSDKYNPLKILALTSIAYLLTYWTFTKTSGLIPIIMWQLPLYPFLDTSINTYIAKYLPKDMLMLGLGLVLVFNAIGGLTLLPLLLIPELNTDILGYLITTASVSALSLITLNLRLRHQDFHQTR